MEIKRNGSQPSQRGQDEYFTGTVRVDPIFQSPGPAQFSGASVTFEVVRGRHGTRTPAAKP